MIQGPLNLDCLWIFTLFTDVRWVIETSTSCNELYPGQECRRDQLQSAESFSTILRTKTFAYLLVTVCLRDTLLATFAFAETPMAFFVAASPVRQKSFSEMHIPDGEGINFYLLHGNYSDFCLSSCQNEARSGQTVKGKMQILWFPKLKKALKSIGLHIKTTVIALVGLKLVVVQYFRDIIKAACGSFKFTRYYRKICQRNRSGD